MEEDGGRLLRRGRRFVGAILQNGGDRLVGSGIEQEGAGAGSVDALWPIALHKSENPDGRAKALFGMRPRAQDDFDQSVRVGPDLGGIATNALMRPVTVAPVGARHMLGDGGRPMGQCAAQMGRDTLAAQEDLDRPARDPCLDLLTGETVRNAVVMFGNLHMVIEIDATTLPFGVLIGLVWHPYERRTVEIFEQLTSAAAPTAQGAIVQIGQKVMYRLVERGEREETAIPQPRQNPSTNDLDSDLYFGFILRVMRPCWQYGGAVMAGEIRIGAVHHRLIEACARNARLEIVAYGLSGHAAKKGKCSNVRRDPIRQALGEGRLSVGVI